METTTCIRHLRVTWGPRFPLSPGPTRWGLRILCPPRLSHQPRAPGLRPSSSLAWSGLCARLVPVTSSRTPQICRLAHSHRKGSSCRSERSELTGRAAVPSPVRVPTTPRLRLRSSRGNPGRSPVCAHVLASAWRTGPPPVLPAATLHPTTWSSCRAGRSSSPPPTAGKRQCPPCPAPLARGQGEVVLRVQHLCRRPRKPSLSESRKRGRSESCALGAAGMGVSHTLTQSQGTKWHNENQGVDGPAENDVRCPNSISTNLFLDVAL